MTTKRAEAERVETFDPTPKGSAISYERPNQRPNLPLFSRWITQPFSYAFGGPIVHKRRQLRIERGQDMQTTLARPQTNGNVMLEVNIEDGFFWQLLDFAAYEPNGVKIGDQEDNTALIHQYISLPPFTRDVSLSVSVDLEVSPLSKFFWSALPGVVISTTAKLAVFLNDPPGRWLEAEPQDLHQFEVEQASTQMPENIAFDLLTPRAPTVSLEVTGTATPATTQVVVVVTTEIHVKREFPATLSADNVPYTRLSARAPGTGPSIRLVGVWVEAR